ncbi:hypothetical protein ALC57_14593 [Trachymyrmex cornetzi]|uniref:Endonuclease/exonuclease/phosphatase domain-containing protein n=1 Tax=Trachymyrmex cornetzi TaxID=471704 RepID=A0A151IYB0_9HYME|nr:hypothetical protein ALC57_14593 [Trachymyrmex cornetzi]
MGVVTLRSEEERGRVLNSKGKLKGSEIWIEEDRTWKEKKLHWKMRQIVRKEGGRARLGQGGIWMEGGVEKVCDGVHTDGRVERIEVVGGGKEGKMAKETGGGGRKSLGEGVKMAFWNVAGLGNKDREFWVNLRRVIGGDFNARTGREGGRIIGGIEKERRKGKRCRGWKVRREYKEICELKKREENEKWERIVELAKNERQVLEIVNGERKKAEEWGSRATCEGESGKGNGDNGAGVGDRKEEVWEGLEKVLSKIGGTRQLDLN